MAMARSSIQQLVADFWERVGYEEPFPRSLERAIMLAAPVVILKANAGRLDTQYVQKWLTDRNIALPAPWRPRRLRGCLVAYRGQAAIFVDGTLSADEARVVLAHEFGHYLAEYERPRTRIIRRLGAALLEVLDGDRPPSREEEFAAALAGIEFGVHVHFMERGFKSATAALVTQVEQTGDVVGAELVAPARAVIASIRRGLEDDRLIALLRAEFGLPVDYARWYAALLAKRIKRQKTFSQLLGL